jgi:hypothetical protein
MISLFTLQHIISFVSGVIVPIIVVLINKKIEAKKLIATDKLAQELQTSIIIDNKLDSLKTEFSADRIWITQFHNGGHYYPTGKSIQKFSIFYEVVEYGVDSIKMMFQNIPVSLFSRSTNQLLEKDYIAIPDFKDETVATYGLKYTADETGCKSTYIFGIFDINNRMIGTLGVEYVKRKKTLESSDIQILEIEAAQIGGVLHNHLIKN